MIEDTYLTKVLEIKTQLYPNYNSINYRAPQNAITYKLSLFLLGGTYKNMLDIIRFMLPYSILWINGFYSFIDILQFLTSKC